MGTMEAGRELDALVAEKVMGWPDYAEKNHCPEYSTDIAAAWLIVEEFVPAYDLSLTWHNGAWETRFILWGAPMQHYTGKGNSEMLAICRAALKAKGIDA